MKIKSVRAFLERIPLDQPYAIAYQSIFDTEIIYFIVTLDNGITGFGASNPFPEVIGETPALTLQNLQSDFIQEFVDKNIEDYAQIIAQCQLQFPHMPGTIAAIDVALLDAYCNFYNKRVVDIFGQHIKSLPTSITIGIKDTKAMLADAEKYYAKGFRILKIKTGISVEEDISRIHYLSEGFGKRMKIRVDANSGYALNQLQQFLNATENLPIELIEQPLPPEKDGLLKTLPDAVKKKLVADESLTDYESAIQLVKQPLSYGVFNIKLMKAGGIIAAQQIAGLAAQQNIDLFWGCNDESLISITAALHIAFACPNTKYLDLDGSLEIAEQLVTGGFELINGEMVIPDKSGLGVRFKDYSA